MRSRPASSRSAARRSQASFWRVSSSAQRREALPILVRNGAPEAIGLVADMVTAPAEYEPAVEALNGQLLPWLAASAAVAFGAMVQGAVGFGMALVAAPLLVLIRPGLVPGPLLVSGLALTLLVARRERDSIDLLGVKWGLVGRVPGIAVGAVGLALIPEESMALLVGILALAGVGLSGSRLRISPSPRMLLVAGFVSGIFGTIASIGGPPLALLYQHETGPRLRGTLAGYFIVGGLMSLAALVAVGRYGRSELLWTLLLLPATLLGFACSGRLTAWVDAGRTRRAVLGITLASGVAAVLRSLA